jgi:azurin
MKFTLPNVPGDYQFVCTFPGHGVVMRGVIKVK